MSYEARIERDSITIFGERLTTMVVTLPRIVLAELNTHKMISKSSASSRAIPSEKQIQRILSNPFQPVYWGKNQRGMSANEELSPDDIRVANAKWFNMALTTIAGVKELMELGVHKQIASRPLESWMWHTVILTATDWSNFFHLRDHKAAQPEIQKAAGMMNELYRAGRPKLLNHDEWHLPFEPTDGSHAHAYSMTERVKMSVGRACQVSYLNHDGESDPTADVRRAESLLSNGHMAPWEHVARPMDQHEREYFERCDYTPTPMASVTDFELSPNWRRTSYSHYLGNVNGWVQARKLLHGESDMLAITR